MWILAFLPLAALSVGSLAMQIAIFPEALGDLRLSGMLLGAGALSLVVALPLGLLAARRATTTRGRHLPDC